MRPLGCATATCAQRPSLRSGCVVPGLIAYRPHPPVRRTSRLFPAPPVIGTLFDIHWILLSVLLTFRAFTAALSRIAAFNTPGAPLRAPQFFRSGTGHRVQVRPLATPFAPPISSVRESLFGASFVRSRYGPPACSPPGLTSPVRPSGPTGLPGLLLPGFQVPGSPHVPAGYHYGTKLRIVPAGLSPASTSASLAAPPSGLSLLDCPGLPPSASAGSPVRASQFFCTGTGHRVEATNPWHSNNPLEPASCGRLFRRLVRSLSLRPSCLLASRAGQTWGKLPGHPRLLLPGLQATGSPRMPAGYHYDAKLRIASAGLSPASTAASLAALPP